MIKVFHCGHDSHHKKPCDILHPSGINNYLFLLVKQHAWVYADGQKHPVQPNSLLLFPPNTPIHYGCDTAGYNDDWIHFDVFDDDRIFFDSFSLPYTTTNMSICQLSLFCGYETDLHFMRQFKRYTGITPSEYRTQARGSDMQPLP